MSVGEIYFESFILLAFLNFLPASTLDLLDTRFVALVLDFSSIFSVPYFSCVFFFPFFIFFPLHFRLTLKDPHQSSRVGASSAVYRPFQGFLWLWTGFFQDLSSVCYLLSAVSLLWPLHSESHS